MPSLLLMLVKFPLIFPRLLKIVLVYVSNPLFFYLHAGFSSFIPILTIHLLLLLILLTSPTFATVCLWTWDFWPSVDS